MNKTFKNFVAGLVAGVSLIVLTGYVGNVLPVNRGGTGSSTKNFVDLTTAQTAAGLKTLTDLTTFNGGIKVGSTGTPVTRIWETTASIDPSAFSSTEASEEAFSLSGSGISASDRCIAWSNPGTDIGNAFPVNVRVSGTEELTIAFYSRVSINPGPMTYTFTFLRF